MPALSTVSAACKKKERIIKRLQNEPALDPPHRSTHSHAIKIRLRVVLQRYVGACLFLPSQVRLSLRTPVIPAVSYLLTGLAGCSVGRGE